MTRFTSFALLSRASLRNLTRRSLATSSNQAIKIIEVSPRDGLQNEKGQLPTRTKVELIHRLQGAGATCIESGAFVSSKWVPQVSIMLILAILKLLPMQKLMTNVRAALLASTYR